MPEDREIQGTPRSGAPFKIVVAIMVVAIVAAIAGFALYLGTRVPDGSAAKVDDSYITEDEVDRYITQYRLQHGLADETALAQALVSQNMTLRTFRDNAIDQLATTMLVNRRAQELGISADESAVQSHIDELKKSLAFDDDTTWEQTLESYGLTQDELSQQYADSLVQHDVCEKDVAHREATDKQTLAYARKNLAGQTARHYYRIVFTGDDQVARAKKCGAALERASRSGKLDAASFQKLAKDESDEENAADNGGDYGWSIDLDQSGEVYGDISDMEEGTVSAQLTISSENATEIFYCDDAFAFPSSKKAGSLEKGSIPESLWDSLAAKESEALWSDDCTKYLAGLVAKAKITYYPMPDNASYNVDLQNITASDSASGTASSEGSSSDSGSSD